MCPDAITLLFKEAFNVFPPIKGKPTNDDLHAIREVLLPILMVIPFNLLGRVHSLTALLMDDTKYAAKYGGMTFVHPKRLQLYNDTIANDASTVVLSMWKQPINPASKTTPVTMRLNAVVPSSYATLSMRSGTTT